MSDTIFHKSSGNVFADMGIPTHEAAFLRVRAQLMVELIRVIRSRKLTQVAAGKLFAISQPRVSDILRGKIDRFSIDALVDMLALAGLQVQVTTKHFVQGDRSRPRHTFNHGVRAARKPKLP